MSDKYRKNKGLIVFLVASMAGLTQGGLILYTPALSQMASAFHVSAALIKMTLTAYLLGFGLSQLFYGPLSDRIGRRKTLLIGLSIASVGAILAVLSTNYSMLILSRCIQGAGFGACMTLSRVILKDSFSGVEYAKKASYLSGGFAVVYGLSPILGAKLIEYFSWQSEFYCLLVLIQLALWGYFFFLPETHFKLKTELSITNYTKQTLKDYLSVISQAKFLILILSGVCAYAVMIAFSTMGPFLLEKKLHYSPMIYSLVTLIIAVFYYLGSMANRYLLERFDINQIMKVGMSLIITSGAILVFISLVIPSVNIFEIVLPLLIAVLAIGLIWSNCIVLALKDLTHIGGTAAAAFSCLQMMCSGVISGIVAIPDNTSMKPFAVTVLTLGVLSLLIFTVIYRRARNQPKQFHIAYEVK
jgi:DHA1 family 2-module integral membrane pump EmrD-like MFS transporter